MLWVPFFHPLLHKAGKGLRFGIQLELRCHLGNEVYRLSVKQVIRRRGLCKYHSAQHCQLDQADKKPEHIKGSCSLLLLKQEGNVGLC